MKCIEAKLALWIAITIPLTFAIAIGMNVTGFSYQSITVDNTAPNVTIDLPADSSISLNVNESLRLQVTISQSASAPSNITKPTYRLNGTKMNISQCGHYTKQTGGWFNTKTTEYWIYNGTYDGWHPGKYVANATVADTVGNTAQKHSRSLSRRYR